MYRALFLDRDGVINKDIPYLSKIVDIQFIYGIFKLVQAAKNKNYKVIIITNQSGVARGYYSKNDFWILMSWMKEQFLIRNSYIDKIYFCPHHPDFTGDCPCRKPNPGMIFKAQKEFDLDLKSSILIGDTDADIMAGINAGVGRNILFPGRYEVDISLPSDLVNSLIDCIPFL